MLKIIWLKLQNYTDWLKWAKNIKNESHYGKDSKKLYKNMRFFTRLSSKKIIESSTILSYGSRHNYLN